MFWVVRVINFEKYVGDGFWWLIIWNVGWWWRGGIGSRDYIVMVKIVVFGKVVVIGIIG